jgi:hypothetical protein
VAAALGGLALAPAGAQIGAQVGGWAADPRSSAVQRCEQALEQRIRSEHPHTDRVITLGGSLVEWPASRASEAGVAGDGKMLRGQSWDDFEFTCWYDGRSGGVSRVEWSGPYHDGQPVRGAHRRQRFDPTPIDVRDATARACLDAVGAEIRREHPRTGRLEAHRGELGSWQRPNGEVVVRGRGRFEGARGGWHEVSFQCGLEARGRRVANAWYELD